MIERSTRDIVLKEMLEALEAQVTMYSKIPWEADKGTLTILIAGKMNHVLHRLQGEIVK